MSFDHNCFKFRTDISCVTILVKHKQLKRGIHSFYVVEIVSIDAAISSVPLSTITNLKSNNNVLPQKLMHIDAETHT